MNQNGDRQTILPPEGLNITGRRGLLYYNNSIISTLMYVSLELPPPKKKLNNFNFISRMFDFSTLIIRNLADQNQNTPLIKAIRLYYENTYFIL